MCDLFPCGEYVRAVLESNDLTTAALLPLVSVDGVTRSLLTDERLVITDVSLNNGGTAAKLTIFQDQDNDGAIDAGETLYAASIPASDNVQAIFSSPVVSMKKSSTANNGRIKVIASAASTGVVIVVTGYVIKG